METQPVPLVNYQLADRFQATQGKIFLTGTQALIRLLLTQKSRDAARGLNTAGFVSGYRGSPLGMVDQQLWKSRHRLEEAAIQFMPAINEDLGVTAVLGSQRAALNPQRHVEGVFGMWYGKGPGVDRAGDALKHANAYGSSPLGGVLVVCGDDHGCVSSSMPHQSDQALQAWSMPILHPGNVAEYLSFGLYGWALSRYSGAWVGFKAISEVVESAMTVDLDSLDLSCLDGVEDLPETDGLHIRQTDLPSLALESRLQQKLKAVQLFSRIHSIDKHIVQSANAHRGIVTVGKAHYDFMETIRRLGISTEGLQQAGIRVYKVGLVFPLEPTRLKRFAQGLSELLVIEEKAPVVESQIKNLLYHGASGTHVTVLGKEDSEGQALISALGELRPSRLMPILAEWLYRAHPSLDRRHLVSDFTPPVLLSNAADGVKRLPYFCSGCPHNTSTRVPEGSRALAGIGCHFMANWMDRSTEGLVQMGAEGVDWVVASRFTHEKHVFQNLGDGTYFHSGLLAIRQAIAAGAHITYKILYNDAVAMTGGQPVDGILSVPRMARQLEAEGVRRLAIVSDQVAVWQEQGQEFPADCSFHDRSELDQVQREFRNIPGVTAIIYEQTCAAEKRRRRKKKELIDPPQRVFIHTPVCEGCGDCGQASNCLSIVPVDTDEGRKRAIEQSSCNKDYSCLNGFCPSMVTVQGAVLKKQTQPKDIQSMHRRADEVLRGITLPPAWTWAAPFDLMVCGIGGTGVVTVGALVTMAAHLEGRYASVLDFMGFAQKGGAVLSFVRLGATVDSLNQVRIDTQQADALLACDLVVGASVEALNTVRKGHTRVVANTHTTPTAQFLRDPDVEWHEEALLEKLTDACGSHAALHCLDAQDIAQTMLGDTQSSNIVMLGACWQLGLVPLQEASLMRAIELNGVAVEINQLAFALGRLAVAAPQWLKMSNTQNQQPIHFQHRKETLFGQQGLLARRVAMLTRYQNAAYAGRYAQGVEKVCQAEESLIKTDAPSRSQDALPLTRIVAHQYARLLAIKDEYEVARLYADPEFEASLREQFESWDYLQFHLAPPFLNGHQERPRKRVFGGYMLRVFKGLSALRFLRGTPLDVFAYTAERRLERSLLRDYELLLDHLAANLNPDNHLTAQALARLPEQVRGFGPVKLAKMQEIQAEWLRLRRLFDGLADEAAETSHPPQELIP